jgi:hypothetical protein
LLIAYLVVFCSFSKFSGDISENSGRWWIAACKTGLMHAAIHLPLLFARGFEIFQQGSGYPLERVCMWSPLLI